MSSYLKEIPVFAENIIPEFVHNKEIDQILLENLDFQDLEGIKILILPIIDQVPEDKRGIARVFLSNASDGPLDLSVYYSITGWFSDLNKLDNLKYIETIKIYPSEVYVRDIVFKSSVKQGKNYFQLVVSKKKARVPKEFVTTHMEYSQIREIIEEVQIERSNYLGMSSKAYINPRSISYWLYYSIFGPNVYRKDGPLLIILKILGILTGGTFIALSFFLTDIFTREYILPAGSIVIIISLLSLLTNADRKKIKLIKEFGLSDEKRKIKLDSIKETTADGLSKYCMNDINFGYNRETNVITWKPGANKLYEKLIVTMSEILNIPTNLEPTDEVIVETAPQAIPQIEESRAVKAVQPDTQEEFGIDLDDEEGIEFDKGVIQPVSEDSKAVQMEIDGVQMDIDVVESDSSVTPEIHSIKTEPKIEQQIEPMVTDSAVEPKIDEIESKTSVEPKIQPIETKSEGLLSDTRGMVSPGKKIDVDTIPAPKKLPTKPKKDSSKSSVKEINEEQ